MGETSDISELLAYLLVSAMATAILLPFLRPVFRQWAGTARASRVRAAISAALLFALVYFGGSTDKQQRTGPFTPDAFFGGQPSLRTDEPPSQPQWYVDLGYPTTDTDGDGIPDYWERRTHTDPSVADAANDPDDDGVDNSEEFLHQCDPVVVDTDGDGLTDREEIDGAAAGWTGFNPISRCAYDADVSDANAWEDEVGVSFYEGQNSAGFPWDVGVPDASAGNVDVCVTVDSSRHAELSWMTPDGAVRLVLPPCTNLTLRLRIPADESSEVSLSTASGATGLWRAALRAEWDTRREQDTERNRVRSGSGWLVDIGNAQTVFSGVLPGTFAPTNAEPARAGEPRRGIIHHNPPMPPSITMYARRANAIEGFLGCRIHGPNPVFVADFTNPAPPFHWIVNDVEFTTTTPELLCILTADTYSVGCFDSGGYSLLPLGTDAVFHVGQCQGANGLEVVGAGWSSTHNPTNAADHLPHIEQTVVEPFGSMCPVYTNTVLTAGWTHNTTILWIRNLVRILTGDPWDDETDHCIALQYDELGVIDLFNYLSEVCTPYRDDFVFKVNGRPIAGHTIPMSSYTTKDDLLPMVLHISFSYNGSPEMDRMWVVLYASALKAEFVIWKTRYSNTSWTATLPSVYSSIALVTNGNGQVSIDASQNYPGWGRPSPISSYLHHNAVYEMRSNPVGSHGHQATYREDGTLICTTIAAGTADFSHPLSFYISGAGFVKERHYVRDVVPFLRAVSLDGNPGVYNKRLAPTNLSRPCIYQGPNIDSYLFLRPTLPTGIHP